MAWRVKGGRTRWGAGRCGERTERCRWQRKRSERVAAVKILSVRRKAAQKFWAPQQGHRPLRKRYKECDAVRNPPATASPCQPPLGKGAMGTGVRIATGALRPRNDTSQEVRGSGGAHGPRPTRAFARIAGGQGRPPLRMRYKRYNGRATARVAPTKFLPIEIRRAGPACPAGSAEKESPSHGFAVPAPFRQGGHGDGGTDCHGRFAPSQ